jgi:starch synthase
MNVGMLVDKPVPAERPTGIGVAAFSMARALSERGITVCLICRGATEKTVRLDDRLTVQTIRRFSRDNLAASLPLLKAGGCDVFHVHSSAAAPSLIAAWALGRPAVFHSHGDQPLHPLGLTLIRNIQMRLSKRVIAVSKSTQRDIIRNHHISPEKVVVAYNGVDLEEFRPITPPSHILHKYGIEGYDKIILSIGALQQRKGQATMIECLPEILKVWPRLIYVNVGNPYDEAFQTRLMEKAEGLGVSKAVKLLTNLPRDDLVAVINAAVLCVHLSVREPFGLAVVEEMACSKAVLAFGVGAIPEIIDDRADGLLVNPDSEADLTRLILAALGDPQWVKKLGEAARKKVAEKFTWGQTASTLENIYREVVA